MEQATSAPINMTRSTMKYNIAKTKITKIKELKPTTVTLNDKNLCLLSSQFTHDLYFK